MQHVHFEILDCVLLHGFNIELALACLEVVFETILDHDWEQVTQGTRDLYFLKHPV